MYAQLLTITIKPKRSPPGCFAQELNGRAEPSCAMHQDAQILELVEKEKERERESTICPFGRRDL